MNGALGRLVYGFSDTSETRTSAARRAFAMRWPPPRRAPWPCSSACRRRRSPAGRDLAAVDTGEARGEEVRLASGEVGVDVPVARRAEAIRSRSRSTTRPRRDGLDPPGRQPGLDLAPQHRAHLVAVEAVEDAAGLLGVDEARVDLARGVRRALDGPLVISWKTIRFTGTVGWASPAGARRWPRPRGPHPWRGRARRRS